MRTLLPLISVLVLLFAVSNAHAAPQITKTVSPASATIGDTVEYTVKVSSAPGDNVYDALVSDTLPDGLAYAGCVSGCANELAPQSSGGTTKIAFALGDASAHTLFAANASPSQYTQFPDGDAVELGMRFTSSENGYIAGLRFYKGIDNVGVHTGSLWAGDGSSLLGTTTFVGESATGWQTAYFAAPIAVVAGEEYVISYYAPNGHYAVDGGFFGSPTVNAPLSSTTPSGVFIYGPGGEFPSNSNFLNNYWVDPIFNRTEIEIKYTATVLGSYNGGALVQNGDSLLNHANLQYNTTNKIAGAPGADDEFDVHIHDDAALAVYVLADVGVTKTAKTGVLRGGVIAYKVKVTNHGPGHATNVVVKDQLPVKMRRVSSPGCSSAGPLNGPLLTCNVGTLLPGQSKTFTILARATSYGSVINSAWITHNGLDLVAGNNHANKKTLIVGKTKLDVTKKANKSKVKIGHNAVFTIRVKNIGAWTGTDLRVCDTLGPGWQVVSAPGAASIQGRKICWDLDTLGKNKSKVYKVTAKMEGVEIKGPDGGHPSGPHIGVSKDELQLSLAPGELRKVTLTCSKGYVTDGSVRVDHVDQDTGNLLSVKVLRARAVSATTYEFWVENTATGNAQAKAFVTCINPTTTGDVHNLVTTGPIVKHLSSPTPGYHEVKLSCGLAQQPIAPGFVNHSGFARLVKSEPVGTSSWVLGFDAEAPGSIVASIRCLNIKVAAVSGHSHSLIFRHVVKTVTLGPGEMKDVVVSCSDLAKGAVATYDLPPGVKLYGHDPQPKSRVFKIHNTTGSAKTFVVDLVCVGDRTTKDTKKKYLGKAKNSVVVTSTNAKKAHDQIWLEVTV